MESLTPAPATHAVRVVTTESVDVQQLAELAARTFPLACPTSAAREDIAAFIDANLSAECFARYLADPHRAILAAELDGRIVGYAMLIHDLAGDAAQLSKIYVAPEQHGAGTAAALMRLALDTAGRWGVSRVWLGVNQKNQRAQRFYAKHGFTVSGTRTFQLGAGREDDYLMSRTLR